MNMREFMYRPPILVGLLACAASTLCGCPDATSATSPTTDNTTTIGAESEVDPGLPTTTSGPTSVEPTSATTHSTTTGESTTGEPTTGESTAGEPTTGEPCPSGAVGCACLEGQVCNDLLVCEVGVCSPPTGTCGDGAVDRGEACDAGPDNGPGQACKVDCTVNVCGDGDVGPSEDCDDGNQVDDDGCGELCKPSGGLLWEAIWDPNDEFESGELGLGIACDRDGRAIAVGEQNIVPEGVKAFIVAYDASGHEQWFHTKHVDGTILFSDSFRAVATDSANNIYAVGTLFNPVENGVSSDWMVLKYSPAGNEAWLDTGGAGTHAGARSVRVDAADDVIVGGIDFMDPGARARVVKYSPDKTVQWDQTFAGKLPSVNGIAVTAAGDYVTVTQDEVVAAKLRQLTSGGATSWSVDLENAIYWNRLSIDGADRSVAVGTEYPGTRMVIRQFAATGVESWTRSPDQIDGINDAYGVAATTEGTIYVAGRLAYDDGPTDTSAWLARYDATGEQVWTIYDPADPAKRWHDVAICPDGAILVVGAWYGDNIPNLIVRKYAP